MYAEPFMFIIFILVIENIGMSFTNVLKELSYRTFHGLSWDISIDCVA